MTATIDDSSSDLRTVRGPLIGLPHLLRLRRNPIHHNDVLRSSYGDVIKLNVFGTTLHACYGLDAAEQILINRDRDFANGPAWSHFIGPFFRRGLMLLDFDEHLHHRRILQHAFTQEAMRRYHAVMVPHIKAGIAGWGDVPNPRMNELFKQLTLDLALETFVGVDLSQAEQDRLNKAFIAAVRAGTSIVRKNVPGTPWAKGLAARKVLEEFFYAHLPAKRRDGGDDLFAQLCIARSEDGDEFSDADIVNHMIFLLMAAHDTSTITMSAMAYYLAKNPEWQEQARAESVAAGGSDYDAISSLDLQERIMKESLRLCSPVPSMPRVAVRDVSVNGYRIPEGSFVAVSPFYNHHDPSVWPDAERFDPERFAEDRREDKAHRMAFHAFGGGVHKCIGMHFAGIQVRAIFHELLLHYRWSVPADYEWPLDLVALPFPRDRLPVTLERL
ncbi:cytochrome P450 [Nocardioides marmoriginsengisoli]|uniref:Cytochrome P450 n=1 Tax=Nocardioides marmoriginsengisoli TaxID=661483 RepID=A0A3N0CCY3_9ACTN|nr:cytochrome P450 [Nocardioides marmoriginsengisoli]RNL61101.1 cytochrome P450 [Nocardioides marmoriginsengisoli]